MVDSLSSPDADDLDWGLRAAFGPGSGLHEGLTEAGAGGETVTARLGLHPPRLLRDEPDLPDARVHAAPLGARPKRDARYQVLGEIARGGVGVVHKSRDIDLGRDVAMKVLQDTHADDPAMVQRFVEEAQIAGQLQHPGILPVYELGLEDDRTPFFTMKLVKGRTLSALLAERPDPAADRPRMLRTFEGVCQTVAYAHSRGVIHRDLKPSNVMVGAFGEVQVVDWGLAKVLDASGTPGERSRSNPFDTNIATVRTGDDHSGSLVGSVMGTPAYMAPEQARGEIDRVDERADVFALGGMLCEILTGHAPYAGADDPVASAAETRLTPALERLAACGADEELITLTRACLDPRPDERPRHAKAVADRMATHLTSIDERARRMEVAAAEARAKATEERRARRLTVALSCVVIVALLAGIAAWLAAETRRRERIDTATNRVEAQLNEASQRLGEAQVAPLGATDAWVAARSAGAHLQQLLEPAEVSGGARTRAAAFLAELDQADRDRQLIETIEDVVIRGATHQDRVSWVAMEQQLRATFRDYGIDLDTLPRDVVATRIRESPLTRQLADGLELWIATCFALGGAGDAPRPPEELFQWVSVLFEADPEPVRTRVRELLYSEAPTREQVETLVASIDLATLHPRTLSWLASIYFRTGHPAPLFELYGQAVLLHPGDFMLNFDFAFNLEFAERWEEAIRYLLRCTGIRPRSAGVWRALGNAYREIGDLPASRAALERALTLRPDHRPIEVDLAYTRLEQGDIEIATAMLQQAVAAEPDLARAHCFLGLALQRAGRLVEALAELERCHELGGRNPMWREPSEEWMDACRAELEALESTRP
ncbi:MAG: protein kinase [Phycisphaerae bacterium]|nr:protein kinase [Phycisphaerae bacterium]